MGDQLSPCHHPEVITATGCPCAVQEVGLWERVGKVDQRWVGFSLSSLGSVWFVVLRLKQFNVALYNTLYIHVHV